MYCNYAFYFGATPNNHKELSDLQDLEGCCGIKLFAGSSTGNLLVEREEDIEKVFQNSSKIVSVHSEDEEILKYQINRMKKIKEAQNLQKQRQANLEHFSNVNELWEVDTFKQVDEAQRAAVNDFLGVQSNYFKARIEVLLNERKRQFSSDLVRKDQAVYVAYRSMSPF